MIVWFLAYTGAREFARETRGSTPDDLLNSVLGGIASGALLGRLQGHNLDQFFVCLPLLYYLVVFTSKDLRWSNQR